MKDISCIEFSVLPDGEIMVKREWEPVFQLKEEHRDIVSQLLDLLRESYPQAYRALAQLYKESERNLPFFEFRMASRFIRCNFAEASRERSDIDEYNILNFEDVRCPLKGTADCPYCGVICRPKAETALSVRELEVLKHVVEGCDNRTIGDRLGISPATVNKHRISIRAKTGLENMPDIVRYFQRLKR